jgi:hypothetical protein
MMQIYIHFNDFKQGLTMSSFSLLLPEVYDRYKLLLHKNDLNIVIDNDMSKLLHFTQLIFNMLKSVLGRALLCYVPKKKNLGRLIYGNDATFMLCVLL